jgi:hypothetical protein
MSWHMVDREQKEGENYNFACEDPNLRSTG